MEEPSGTGQVVGLHDKPGLAGISKQLCFKGLPHFTAFTRVQTPKQEKLAAVYHGTLYAYMGEQHTCKQVLISLSGKLLLLR